jgi:predicted nucleic acid-binding protein
MQEQGKIIAQERLELINTLPLTQIDVNTSLIEIIGELKATKYLSFADSCVAGLAKSEQAILVHKDPEFGQIGPEIQQFKLPYKSKYKNN